MNTNSNKLMNNNPNTPRLRVLVPVLLCIAGAVIAIAIFRGPRPEPPAQPEAAAEAQTNPATAQPPVAGKPPHEWGIEVVGLYSSVHGRALDLRYRILDTAKAALLPNEPGGIYLIDEATGATTKLPNSPRTGSIPQNPQKLHAGRTYSLALPNPDGRFTSGSRLTLAMGQLRAEHLTVL